MSNRKSKRKAAQDNLNTQNTAQQDAPESAAQNATSANDQQQPADTSATSENSASAPNSATGGEENAPPNDASNAQQEDTTSGAENSESKSSEEQPADKDEPSIDDIGKNNPGGRRGPTGPRLGAQAGAKPLIRKLMGTPDEHGFYPSFTLEELCEQTKKSEVNVRTILSDLRSPKYCGTGGVFMTTSSKNNGVTRYRYSPPQEAPQPDQTPPPADDASASSNETPPAGDTSATQDQQQQETADA